jgi:hypothetical protein
MKLEISLVPYGLLTHAIGNIGTYLETAADLTVGRCSVDDIVRMIFTGQYSLWLVLNKEQDPVVGFFALEVKQYPQRRLQNIQQFVIDSGSMAEIEPLMQDIATRFAKDNGCSGIEFVGRPGWRRYSKEHGYASHMVTYQKFFDLEQE